MMRSWGSRADAVVCDEPLYAHYLTRTADRRHPGYDETLANHDAELLSVIRWLTGPIPQERPIFYQKQMAHHLLPEVELEWIDGLTSAFLIRDPREMLTSLLEFLPDPRVEDTGLPQQAALFERVRQRTGLTPPVLDAADVLRNPRRMLALLCDAVDVPFREEMLKWAPGPRDTDGAWAPFWYAKVYETTTFAPYKSKGVDVPERLAGVLAECERLYQQLYTHRLR